MLARFYLIGRKSRILLMIGIGFSAVPKRFKDCFGRIDFYIVHIFLFI